MFEVSIPKISDEEMMKRYEQIKPVITVDGKLHYLREFSLKEIKGISYLWNVEKDIREEVKENELCVWQGRDFACIHGYGYCGFFKPSIGEVLSQLRDYEIPFIKAFEIIEEPTTSSDFRKDMLTSIIFDKGYHVSTVRLYCENN